MFRLPLWRPVLQTVHLAGLRTRWLPLFKEKAE